MLRFSVFLICIFMAAFQPLQGQNADEQINASRCWVFEQDEFEVFEAVGIAGGAAIADRSASIIRISDLGEKLWQSEQIGHLDSNLVVDDSGIYFVAGSKSDNISWFREISLQTGLPVYSLELTAGGGWRLTRGVGPLLYVFNAAKVIAFDIESREKKWDRPFNGDIAALVEGGEGNVWVLKKDGTAIAIAVTDGSELHRFNTVATPVSAMHFGRSLLVGTANGDLRSFRNGAGAPNWKFRAGGRISHLLNDTMNVLAASDDNFIYSFDQRNGSLRWKRRLGGRVTDLKIVNSEYAAAKVLDATFWEMIEVRTGRVAGRVMIEQADKSTFSLVRLDEGFAVGLGRGIIRYSLSKCTN